MRRLGRFRSLVLVIFLAAATFFHLKSSDRQNEVPAVVQASPRIAVVSMTTKERAYDHTAISNKYEYAEKHGYTMAWDFKGPRGVWDKFNNIGKLVERNQFDWIWWIDYDTLITNMTVKIEEIIAESLEIAQKRDMKDPAQIDAILTPDCQPLNTGSMIFRSTPWVMELFAYMDECERTRNKGERRYSEQDCLRDAIKDNEHRADDKSVIIPQWKMNAFPEEIKCYEDGKTHWENGMFLVHFAGAAPHLFWLEDSVRYLMHKYKHYIIS